MKLMKLFKYLKPTFMIVSGAYAMTLLGDKNPMGDVLAAYVILTLDVMLAWHCYGKHLE